MHKYSTDALYWNFNNERYEVGPCQKNNDNSQNVYIYIYYAQIVIKINMYNLKKMIYLLNFFNNNDKTLKIASLEFKAWPI